MEYSFIEMIRKPSLKRLIESVDDIAIVSFDGVDNGIVFLFSKVFQRLCSSPEAVKSFIFYNKAEEMLENRILKDFPTASIEKKAERITEDTINDITFDLPHTLVINLIPSNHVCKDVIYAKIEKETRLYYINIEKTGNGIYDLNVRNSLSSIPFFERQGSPSMTPYCQNRKDKFEEFLKNGDVKAAFDFALHEIKFGCESCNQCHNYQSDMKCPMAQLLVAKCYAEGIYKQASDILSYDFYAASARQGYPEAEICWAGKAARKNNPDLQKKAVEILIRNAKNGSMNAALKLECLYVKYHRVAEIEAIPIMVRMAAAGMPFSIEYLIKAFAEGDTCLPADEIQMEEWARFAKEHDIKDVARTVSKIYAKNTTWDREKEFQWRLFAAQEGDSESQVFVAERYYEGIGVEQNMAEARKWYVAAAEAGNENAFFRAAYICWDGQGGPKDFKKAFAWFETCAQKGNTAAINNLGCMYGNGDGVVRDDVKATELYKKAAEMGSAVAADNYGWNLQNGRGIDPDLDAARKWFEISLSRGYSKAAFHLGEMYRASLGVHKDIDMAVGYFEKAIQMGNDSEESGRGYRESVFPLAEIYQETGKPDKAFKIWELAAELDYARAFYELGVCYAEGIGVEVDRNRARTWLLKAQDKNYSLAKQYLI